MSQQTDFTPAPQTVPATQLPMKVYEAALKTGPDSSSGLATAGFRTAKYLPPEWHQSNYHLYHKAFSSCEESERNRDEAKELSESTAAATERAQKDSTAALGQRLQDIHFWKTELQKAIEELDAETNLLAAQKLRLERALDATEVPYAIATDNLQCRERRQPPDLVCDEVERELLKEAELIRNIQELLKRTLMQASNQILNRDHKEICEMDWSDKVETYNIDDKCGRYKNQSTNIQFHPSSVKFEESKDACHSKPIRCSLHSEEVVTVSLNALCHCRHTHLSPDSANNSCASLSACILPLMRFKEHASPLLNWQLCLIAMLTLFIFTQFPWHTGILFSQEVNMYRQSTEST
uniref:Tektin n=1 Tax=Pavo cristatus TaxID=9049 RepID=A0A8C9L8B1_PAVCR